MSAAASHLAPWPPTAAGLACAPDHRDAAAQANAEAAAAVVAGLSAGGVRHLVMSPGSRNTPLVLAAHAAHARGELALYVVLDERVAAFVALGVARATHRPAALCCTSGSAGGHYLPAVIEAAAARVPLVVITADRPPELHGHGAPQTVEQRGLFGAHVRSSLGLPTPCPGLDARVFHRMAERAAAGAMGSPAGPVHLNAPFRKPLWAPLPAGLVMEAAPVPVSDAQLLVGDRSLGAGALADLADTLRGAQRGLVVCGPRAPATLDPEALAASVAALARWLGWPLIADVASGLRFGPHDRSQLIAHADAMVAGERAAEHLRPDLVLHIGQHPTGDALGRLLAQAPACVRIDADGVWHDPDDRTTTLVVADPICLGHRLAALPPPPLGRWLDTWRRLEASVVPVITRACTGPALWEGGVAHAVARARVRRLHVASSMPIRDLDTFGGSHPGALDIQANRGANGIDGTVSTALGAAWAAPDDTHVALLGDLALLHDMGGVLAASAPNLVLVAVNNGGGGIFGELPIAAHPTAFEACFLTPPQHDLTALAGAAGLRARRVQTPAELALALAEPVAGPRARLIEAVVDRARSSRTRRETIRAVTERVDEELKRCL